MLKYLIGEAINSFTHFFNYLNFDEYEHSFPYEIFTVVYHSYIPNNFLKGSICEFNDSLLTKTFMSSGKRWKLHGQGNVQCLLSSLQVILTAAIEFI